MTARELWTLGREVSFALSGERFSTLKPTRDNIKRVAAGLGITQTLARRAWSRYTWEAL